MGDFRIQIEGVGNHGCQRDVKSGEEVSPMPFFCEQANCVDCSARNFVQMLGERGNSITSATLMHWPQSGPQIVDDLKTRKRTGSF